MRISFLRISLAAAATAFILAGCASSNESGLSANGCQSKWVAAGNNGAKADRYYQPNCQ